MSKIRFGGLLVILLLVVLVVWGFPLMSGQIQKGGILRYGLSGEFPQLDPWTHTPTVRDTVLQAVHRGLVGVTLSSEGKIKLTNELAESYETTDSQTWIFHLRKNAKFHNGDPVTARDVKFSFEKIAEPATNAELLPYFEKIDEIIIMDEHTVKIVLKEPNGVFPTWLAIPSAAVVPEDWWESQEDPTATMMGAGPFKFVKRIGGIKIVTERFGQYYREDLPYLDGIEFFFYPDEEARATALFEGEVDVIGYPAWRYRSEMEADPNIQLAHSAGQIMNLSFNLTEEPWDNVLVREAIGYALDREAFVEGVFYGYAELEGGPTISPQIAWAYNPDLEGWWEYNPEKAKRLLAKAGYPDGFKTTLMSSYTYAMYERTAEIALMQLREVGIDATIDLVEWPVWVERKFSGRYSMAVGATMLIYPDPDAYLNTIFAKPVQVSYGIEAGEVSFPTLDYLLERGRRITDRKERAKIYRELELLFLGHALQVPICGRFDGFAANIAVKNFNPLTGQTMSQVGTYFERVWLDR